MVRLWLAMAVVAAVAVCLYALFLGFAAGSAVAAWVPAVRGSGPASATTAASATAADALALPAPRPAAATAAATTAADAPALPAPRPVAATAPATAAADAAAMPVLKPPAEAGTDTPAPPLAPLPGAPPAVQSGTGAPPRPLILPHTGPVGTWLDEALFRRALERRLALVRPDLAPSTRAGWAGQIALRAVAWHLNPWLVFAVIDVESSFQPRMVGQAGEIGLMQVLPSTGRLVAERALGIRRFAADDLFQPAWNIRIGTAYLGSLVQGFDGDVPMALAAYNAGDAVRAPTGYSWLVLGRLRRLGAAVPTPRPAAS